MKFVVQRVTEASVTVDEKIVGKIGKGFLVLVGVSDADDKA
ncbi:MAG: D-aminoacyl-tRNA deacylase, partial [Lachnospiraceae bacterium]|nr:D-aminoacyl-tRNA deacylase [Lachnospiraceae bacterium]